MNSRQLRKSYSSVYENFKDDNDLVVSTPLVFDWTPSSFFNEVISCKQALPLRMYLGVKFIKGSSLEFGNYSYFCPIKNNFTDTKFELAFSYLEKIINFYEPVGLGFKVSLLSESGHDVGLGFEAGLSLLVALSNAKLLGLDDTKSLIIENAKALYKDITGGYIDTISLEVSYDGKGSPAYHSNDSQIKYFSDLFGIQKNIRTVDYSVVYSGVPINEQFVSKRDVRLTKSVPIDDIDAKLDLGLTGTFWKTSNEMLNHINTNAIKGLLNLYRGLTHEDEINNCINTLGRARTFLYTFLILSRVFMLSINRFMFHYDVKFGRLAIIPHYRSLVGGCYTVVLSFSRFRAKFIDVATKGLKNEYSSSYVVYTSRDDGVCNEGLTCDKNFFKKGSMVNSKLISLDGVYHGSYEELLGSNYVDVLFDSVQNKVYLNNEKLTSKDIHSQSIAVEVMSKLIIENKNRITNRDLPRSSYSKDRNTMSSKVISPLNSIIKSKLGKNINLSCSGSISDFTIHYHGEDISLGVIVGNKDISTT